MTTSWSLYVFWELTTVFSYLLIGSDPAKRASRQAALQALIVTTLGGLAMLVGMLMLGQQAGTFRISELLAHPPTGTATAVAIALVLVGALSKSALVPFHFWLPGAMAAPTPVSAYLHAASMVKAGVYLVALLAPAFAGTAGWHESVLVLGVGTMLLGGWRALRQYDVKLLLAYGTVSQLGFLIDCLRRRHAGGSPRRDWRCCWPTRCSRRRCSWSSASSTTRPVLVTFGRSPASAVQPRCCVGQRSSQGRRWPVCHR